MLHLQSFNLTATVMSPSIVLRWRRYTRDRNFCAFVLIVSIFFQSFGIKILFSFCDIDKPYNEANLLPQVFILKSYNYTDDMLSRELMMNRRASGLRMKMPYRLSNDACRFLIMQKTIDAHYETFESIALKYPLPFHDSKRQPECASAGFTKDDPIVVDYVMPYNWQGGFANKNKSEGWGWEQYFKHNLQGTVSLSQYNNSSTNHLGRQRYIKFGSVLGLDKNNFRGIQWGSYAFFIEASCDMWGGKHALRWLKDESNHCVLHKKADGWLPKSDIKSRVCFLNPQFESFCWFIPNIFPKFENRPPLSQSRNKNDSNESSKLNLCVGWKSVPNGPNMRDASLLVNALSPYSQMTKVIVLGRNAKVPVEFQEAGLSHIVEVHDARDYVTYQELVSSCHALVPLIDYPRDALYFLGPDESQQGRLSGMIAQVIGNRIPSVVHSKVAEIYKNEFTAQVFTYKDGASFPSAMRLLYDHYFPPEKCDVPLRLHLVYISEDPDKILPPNEILNQNDIIDQYQETTGNKTRVHFWNKEDCDKLLLQSEHQLLPFMQKEQYGPHKSDICRLAVLYNFGGYYLDNDTKVLKPMLMPKNKTFSTVKGLKEGQFSQGIIFASPRHPVIRMALKMTLDHYRGVHLRNSSVLGTSETSYYSTDTGTKILYDAYIKASSADPSLEAKSLFLREVILKQDKKLLSRVDVDWKNFRTNFCTAAFLDENKEHIFFLARAPGTSYC